MASSRSQIGGGLLLYHRPAFFPDAATITDHIESFVRHSRFPFFKLNTDGGFPRRLGDVGFDVVVLHYSVFASGPDAYLLDEGFLDYLDCSGAYKVAFFQDEHQYCRRRFRFLDRHKIDCVYTCYEPEHFAETYERYTSVPKLVSHVPAYVSPDMVARAERVRVPEGQRRVDIGYRARPMPPYVGRGGLEKVEIGECFAERAAVTGLTLDITTREQDRLYGDDWYRFIAGCNGFLGTESGVSCSDLEDEVREEYECLVRASQVVTVERLEQGALGRWDWKVPLRTSSSRHFEAAALEVCQILYEGHYSGALRPMEHYIPLKKDFSNFDEVVTRFQDPELRRELTANAHRDLIESGAHSYERFIESFDRTLIEAGVGPPEMRPSADLVPSGMKGRSAEGLGRRYVGGAMFWLHRNHPFLLKLAKPALMLLYVLSRPAIALARAIRRFAARLRWGSEPA